MQGADDMEATLFRSASLVNRESFHRLPTNYVSTNYIAQTGPILFNVTRTTKSWNARCAFRLPLMKNTPQRRSLRYFNYYFSLRGVFENLCGGGTLVFVSFALSIGIARERVALITTVTSAACIMQMLAIFLANRIHRKKRYILILSFIEPLLMAAAVLAIPFMPPAWRFTALMVAVFLAAGALHLTKPFTDGWMATIIPAGLRGRYIGRRVQWLTLSTVLATLTGGFLLQFGARGAMLPTAMILVVGALFGILSVLQLRTLDMPAVAAVSKVTLADVWAVISGRYPLFHRYLLGMLIYLCPFFLAIPYYQVYYLRILHMPEGFVAMMSCVYFAVKIMVMPFCGRFTDRFGGRLSLLVAGVIYVVFFAGFSMSHETFYWPVLFGWALVSIADGFYAVAIASALFASVPDTPNRNVFFAVSNLVALGGYGIGALIAMPILSLLQRVEWTNGPFRGGQFQVYYGLCALLMAGCLFSALMITPAHRAGHR